MPRSFTASRIAIVPGTVGSGDNNTRVETQRMVVVVVVVVLSMAIGDNDTAGFHAKAMESMQTRMIMVAMAAAVTGVASEVVLVTLVVIYHFTYPISGELEFPPLRRRIDNRHHSPHPCFEDRPSRASRQG